MDRSKTRHFNRFLFLMDIIKEMLSGSLQKQNLGEVNAAFIRALVTAVTVSSMDGEFF